MDRRAEFDNGVTCNDDTVIILDNEHDDDEALANPAAYAIFQRYLHDACMNIELAVEGDALDGHEWQRLSRQLNYIADIASLFSKEELGLLSGELAQGLEILSPRARVRRLRNARNQFTRLAARDERIRA